MTAREALRRIAARALANPDFNAVGITDVNNLRDELQREHPEFFISGGIKSARSHEHLSQPLPVWT